jgi:metal-sulfur cluster biosynthetic enzyme
MSESLREQIVAALDQIKDPCSVATGLAMGLAEMGLIKAVRISEAGEVDIDLRLTAPFCHMINFFQEETAKLVGAIAGVVEVRLHPDNGLDWSPDFMAPEARSRRAAVFDKANAALNGAAQH